MEKTFRPWDVDQAWLFPPSVRDLVPDGHLAHFIRDLVRDELDLSRILEAYREARGFPPYHPAMMTALLLYGYSQGIYCSEANLAELEARGIRAYVATGRQKHGTASPTNREQAPRGPRTRAMRKRLRQGGWRSRYRLRKQTVEPVFGQIKEARGFRRFLMRGLEKVQGEWSMLCTAHNLLELHMALGAS